jgi:peptidoglycan-N-acetylmuramic acid deacetylase
MAPANTAYGKTGHWGLGFGAEGSKPSGNESADFLKQYDAYYVASGEEKVIYLTFDAGYENGYTSKILDVLKAQSIPATFFLVGTYVNENPELVKRMVAEGHIVGNHTMRHPDMSAISDEGAFKTELEAAENAFKTVTGIQMSKFYRPPRGQYSEKNLQMAKKLGYKTIFWSIAYADWNNDKQPSAQLAFSKLLPRVHPGAILLLHNTSKTNSEILASLIEQYKAKGYIFKNLNDLT